MLKRKHNLVKRLKISVNGVLFAEINNVMEYLQANFFPIDANNVEGISGDEIKLHCRVRHEWRVHVLGHEAPCAGNDV